MFARADLPGRELDAADIPEPRAADNVAGVEFMTGERRWAT